MFTLQSWRHSCGHLAADAITVVVAQRDPCDENDLPSTELLVKEDPGRVIMVWMEYHQDKEGAVGSILSRPEMDTYLFRSKKS